MDVGADGLDLGGELLSALSSRLSGALALKPGRVLL
jgi:hypothetical protein